MSVIFKHLKGNMSKADDFLKELFRMAVSAVQPRKLINQAIGVNDRHLVVNGKTYFLAKPAKIVGFGKAVHGMAVALDEALGPLLQRGIVSVPEGSLKNSRVDSKNMRIEYLEGARNNLPDENSLNAAIRIKDFVSNLQEDDTVIVLISGGGSALLPLPKDKITLFEKLELVKKLGNKGADIFEMNCVRKELSKLKGGGLAVKCYPARVITLILSDVLGDPIDIIASGPTTPNKDGPQKAMNILKKYSLFEDLPFSIKETLENNLRQTETIDDKIFEKVDNFIIGNNKIAAQAVLEQARELELQCFILSTNVCGDVEEITDIYDRIASIFQEFRRKRKTGDELIERLLSIESNLVPFEENWKDAVRSLNQELDICIVLAGEPTVKVTGKGIGGRNQQLALSLSIKMSKNKDDHFFRDVRFLSCGTDGIDGPTDAAGAIGFSELVFECKGENLDPEAYLKNNDCYNFYQNFSGGKYLVKVGHTGTNVMDIHLMLFRK